MRLSNLRVGIRLYGQAQQMPRMVERFRLENVQPGQRVAALPMFTEG